MKQPSPFISTERPPRWQYWVAAFFGILQLHFPAAIAVLHPRYQPVYLDTKSAVATDSSIHWMEYIFVWENVFDRNGQMVNQMTTSGKT